MFYLVKHGNDFAERLQGKDVKEDLDADTNAIMALFATALAKQDRESRIDEVHRYLNRSDSLSEEKYARRRIKELDPPQEEKR